MTVPSESNFVVSNVLEEKKEKVHFTTTSLTSVARRKREEMIRLISSLYSS